MNQFNKLEENIKIKQIKKGMNFNMKEIFKVKNIKSRRQRRNNAYSTSDNHNCAINISRSSIKCIKWK